MADSESKSTDEQEPTPSQGEGPSDTSAIEVSDAQAIERSRRDDDVADVAGSPAQLGTTRYVHAAFFAATVLVAYLSGKILESIWNSLADWPPAVHQVPLLVRYAEDERPTFTMMIGGVIGLLTAIQVYRKQTVRNWADEVAAELAKVHWPGKEIVTNGTIVVLVAGLFATIYIGLLDRLWGFVTTLVYGA